MSNVAVMGVDGFRAGWVAAVHDGQSIRWRVCADAVSLFAEREAVTAIDIPMGLPTGNAKRLCDIRAREALEPRARSSVFFTPPRELVEAPEMRHAAAVAWLRAQGFGGISVQAHGILNKIRDVDRCLSPQLEDEVIEVHPELSFRRMAQHSSMPSKKTAAGVGARLRALTSWLDADPVELLEGVPAGVPVDDALDALACAWTATRWLSGAPTLSVLPDDHEVPLDDRALPMRIVT